MATALRTVRAFAPKKLFQMRRLVQIRGFNTFSELKQFSAQVSIPVNGQNVAFDSIFLRDSCTCPACVDTSSRQKNFQTTDIPGDVQGSYLGTQSQDGTEFALVGWNKDVVDFPKEHNSQISLDLLARTAGRDDRRYISHFQPRNRVFWDGETMEKNNIFLDFESYVSDDKALYRALRQLESHGLVFLKNVPDCAQTDSSASLNKIVDRIGNIRSTFYGLTWDVRSVPKAINVAYTNKFLGLHMDLCYVDLTPHFQFLHSLRARAPGGDSIFSDSLRAAEVMRTEDPELFKSLVEFPVTFHYYNAGQSYRQVRTTVELADRTNFASPIRLINWSPPFQGPFSINTGLQDGGHSLRKFLEAAKRFDLLISNPSNLYEYRMKEGECVIFDNRRVLHARRAFDPSKGGEVAERGLLGQRCIRE